MTNLFVALFFLALLALVVGLIRPAAVIYWGDDDPPGRGRVFKVYGLSAVALFFLIGIVAPPASSVQGTEPGAGIADPDATSGPAPTPDGGPSREGVTMAGYKKLKTGMSYQEVVAILGEDGTELSSTEPAETVMYQWQQSGGGNLKTTFRNNGLVQKAQFGLR